MVRFLKFGVAVYAMGLLYARHCLKVYEFHQCPDPQNPARQACLAVVVEDTVVLHLLIFAIAAFGHDCLSA